MVDHWNHPQRISHRTESIILFSTMCRLRFYPHALQLLVFATLHLRLQLTPQSSLYDFDNACPFEFELYEPTGMWGERNDISAYAWNCHTARVISHRVENRPRTECFGWFEHDFGLLLWLNVAVMARSRGFGRTSGHMSSRQHGLCLMSLNPKERLDWTEIA